MPTDKDGKYVKTAVHGHMMNTVVDGKPALVSYMLVPATAPANCPDCASPGGSVSLLYQSYSTDSGFSWGPQDVVSDVLPPPLTCTPTNYGPNVSCYRCSRHLISKLFAD